MSKQDQSGRGSVTKSQGDTERLPGRRSGPDIAHEYGSGPLALVCHRLENTLQRIAEKLEDIVYILSPSDDLIWMILLPDDNWIEVRVMTEPRLHIEVVGLWSSPIDYKRYQLHQVMRCLPDMTAGFPLISTLGMAVWALACVLQTLTARALSRTETLPGNCPFV